MSRAGVSPSAGDAPETIETRADLARELTALRSRSGLTVRELARRLDTPTATIGDYFSGRHLPSPAQLDLFRAILRECGVTPDGLRGWIDALTRVRLSSDARVGRVSAPYRGLEPFQTEDAGLFFGRESATEEVLGRLLELRDGAVDAADQLVLLLVVGPSGSGKSSLLRAGLEARVRSGALDEGDEPWSAAIMTPGDAPVEALDACLARLPAERRLLILDQLEELFSASAQQRREFLAALAGLRPPNTLLVAGLRSDFYDAALSEPVLLPAFRRSQILIGPMSQDELRRAIVEPARQSGVPVDDGLVDLLLSDLAPGSVNGFAHEAGALPLLSYALLSTWERATRNQLTIADYRAAGGLRGAVSQRAEELYGALTADEQELARRIFCRLVRVEEHAPYTRRRVARHELEELDGSRPAGIGDDRPPVDSATVLSRFVAARLVTVDATTVELSHEALLTAWPRLADWLDRDRAGLRLHRQLTDATNAWIEGNRDQSLLLRGPRLQLTADWAHDADHEHELNRAEREFRDASLALAEAERLAARNRTRRVQRLLAAVALLAIAAVALAAVAFSAKRGADRTRDQALSRQVAIEATDLQPTDPALAMQLALAAYRISPTTQATSTLLDTSAYEMPTRILGPIGPTSMALSQNGHWLAVAYAAADQVSLYALAGRVPRRIATISAGSSSSQLFAVAFSPNAQLLATGGTDQQTTLWSLAKPAHPVKLAVIGGLGGTIYGLRFSPNGQLLAAADSDGTVRQWSLRTPSEPLARPVLTAPGRPSFQAVSYSPSGRTVAAAGANGSIAIWRVKGGVKPLATRTAGATTLTSIAYSPGGTTLAAGAQNSLIYLWHLDANGLPQTEHAPLHGFTSWVDSLTFSANGDYLAAGDSDNSLRVWATANWKYLATLDHPAPVTGVAFTPSGQSLITVDEDGTTRIWSFPPPATYTAPGSLYTIDYTANGGELAAVSGGPDGDVTLWNVANPWRPVQISAVTPPASFGPVAGVGAFSPNGKLLAVGNVQAKVRLVDLADARHPRLIGGVLGGAVPDIEQLNFSPNMRLLSVGDDAGRIHLWDVTDPANPSALPTLDPKGSSSNVFGVAYSPNGKLMAVAAADDKVWLWDIADLKHPRRLAVLGGFKSYAYTVTFTPNGRTLIAGSADNTVRLWNVTDPAHPRALGPPLTGPTSTVYQVAVSPDGSTLAASTTDQAVWLWNIRNPAKPVAIADLTAATGQVFDVNFSPNDRTLVAGGTDQLLTFWDFHPSQVATRICALAGTPITRAEWAQYIQGAAYDPPCR